MRNGRLQPARLELSQLFRCPGTIRSYKSAAQHASICVNSRDSRYVMHEIARRLFSSRRAFIFALILAAVTIFAYRPAWNGGFLWDDDVYITNNELLTAPDGLRRIWFSLDSPSSRSSGTPRSRILMAITTPKTITAKIQHPERKSLPLLSTL